MMIRWKVITMTLSLLTVSSSFDSDDSIHYTIEYRKPDAKSILLEEDDQSHMVIHTRDKEHYTCSLPQINEPESDYSTTYSGPTPWELIAPLRSNNVCTKRYDAYWSYEVCHGKYILQFHDGKEEKLQYYLGNFHPNYITLKWEANRDTVKVNNEQLPYLPVLYSQGTTCDITGQPRTTKLLYVCSQGHAEFIESVTEISTCTYQVIVLTNKLCSHPFFARSKGIKNRIICTMNETRDDPKPLQYLPLATAQKENFHKQYSNTNRKVIEHSFDTVSKEGDTLNQLYTQMEEMHKLKGPSSSSGKDLMSRILSGDKCLEGTMNGDYWMYSYCHLKHIIQFHYASEHSISVKLGEFHIDEHQKWLKKNPEKRPHKYNGNIEQVVHYYSNGDICEETGGKRSVETRIRCPKSPISDAFQQSFRIDLSEPNICEYILTIISPPLCELIQTADNDGLF